MKFFNNKKQTHNYSSQLKSKSPKSHKQNTTLQFLGTTSAAARKQRKKLNAFLNFRIPKLIGNGKRLATLIGTGKSIFKSALA